MIRVVAAIATILSTAASGLLAEQQKPPTFSAKTTLLTLDVTALDRDGKPVPGLTAEDFEVKINGRIQLVQAVAYLEAPRDAAVAPAISIPEPVVLSGLSGRRVVTNPAPRGESRVFVIFVDDLSFEPGFGKALFVAAEAFVARLPASDYVGYNATSGTDAVNPTRDRRAVLVALKRAVGRFINPTRSISDPPMLGIGEAMQIDGGDREMVTEVMLRECFDPKTAATMTNLGIESLTRVSPCAAVVPFRANHIAEQIKATRASQIQGLIFAIDALRGVPGIKHVVILSNGLAISKEIEDLMPVARAAARAGVELSTMVEEGEIDLSDLPSSVELPGGGSGPVNPGQAQKRREDDQMLLGGAQTMTDMAGGQFYRVIGQPRRFFDRVEASASGVYRLGVGLPADLAPGRDVDVTARVKRAGVSASSSHHAAAPAAAVPASPEEQMRNAVARGETLYGVPIAFGAVVRRSTAPGQLEIGATASVPASIPGPLNTVFGLLDGTGALKTGKRSTAAAAGSDYRVTFSMPVSPGIYQLRFAAADASGEVGSVTMPVNATLARIGPLEVSDLFIWIPDAAGRMQLLPFDDVPPGVGTLTAMLELYPIDAAQGAIAVRLGVVDASGRTVQEHDATVTAGSGVLRADGPLQIDGLPVGSYGVRATVSAAGKAVGVVSTTFRKR